MEQYNRDAVAYQKCLAAAAAICSGPAYPGGPPRLEEFGGLPGAPAIDPRTAAQIAFARLKLAAPNPVIGPSPSINQWKMAAVGYPLWLSVAGDTHPPAVSDSVAGLSVRLEAKVSKVTFNMGDGHRVACTDVTKKWTSSVTPGKKSPACGYAYSKPSLPRGEYTITATTQWSVVWSTSTERGVIDFFQSSSTQLPVGELQVLVR